MFRTTVTDCEDVSGNLKGHGKLPDHEVEGIDPRFPTAHEIRGEPGACLRRRAIKGHRPKRESKYCKNAVNDLNIQIHSVKLKIRKGSNSNISNVHSPTLRGERHQGESIMAFPPPNSGTKKLFPSLVLYSMYLFFFSRGEPAAEIAPVAWPCQQVLASLARTIPLSHRPTRARKTLPSFVLCSENLFFFFFVFNHSCRSHVRGSGLANKFCVVWQPIRLSHRPTRARKTLLAFVLCSENLFFFFVFNHSCQAMFVALALPTSSASSGKTHTAFPSPDSGTKNSPHFCSVFREPLFFFLFSPAAKPCSWFRPCQQVLRRLARPIRLSHRPTRVRKGLSIACLML